MIDSLEILISFEIIALQNGTDIYLKVIYTYK